MSKAKTKTVEKVAKKLPVPANELPPGDVWQKEYLGVGAKELDSGSKDVLAYQEHNVTRRYTLCKVRICAVGTNRGTLFNFTDTFEQPRLNLLDVRERKLTYQLMSVPENVYNYYRDFLKTKQFQYLKLAQKAYDERSM